MTALNVNIHDPCHLRDKLTCVLRYVSNSNVPWRDRKKERERGQISDHPVLGRSVQTSVC